MLIVSLNMINLGLHKKNFPQLSLHTVITVLPFTIFIPQSPALCKGTCTVSFDTLQRSKINVP